MQQSVKSLIAAFALSSCGIAATQSVDISINKCWNKIPEGAIVHGNAMLYYFPNQKAFIANKGCPNQTIGIAAGGGDQAFKKLDFLLSRRRAAIGVAVSVDLTGKMFISSGSRRKELLSVSLLEVSEAMSPIYISDY